MIKRKLQAVINRIEDDVNALKHLLKSKYKKREQIDVDVFVDIFAGTGDDEVVNVEAYNIDLEIESINGNIEGLNDAINRLEMLKESI